MSEQNEIGGAASLAGRGGSHRAEPGEGDDSRWGKVYAAVIVFTVVVIAALWAFSRAFSS